MDLECLVKVARGLFVCKIIHVLVDCGVLVHSNSLLCLLPSTFVIAAFIFNAD